MDFSKALNMCKAGKSIRRKGWNGADQFVYYVPEGKYEPSTKVAKKCFGGDKVPYRAYLAIKTVQGDVVPWLASQSDLLSDDWECYFKKVEKPKTKPIDGFVPFNPFPWIKNGYVESIKPPFIPTCSVISDKRDDLLDASNYGLSLSAKKKEPTRSELQANIMTELIDRMSEPSKLLSYGEYELAKKLTGIISQKKDIMIPVPPIEALTSYDTLINWITENAQAGE